MEKHEPTTLTVPNLYDKKLEDLLTDISHAVHYAPKDTFLVPGEKINFIYYIKKGSTRHYMVNEDGVYKMLYTLTPGWFFGETPYFMKTTTGIYSQAAEDSVLYKIPGEYCDMLIKDNKLFRDKILRCFSSKMLILRYEIANLTFNSCKERLKRIFCASIDEGVSEDGWCNLKIKYTHQELGEILGGTRVTISRQINELCKDGFIRILNRNIQVNRKKCSEHLGLNEIEVAQYEFGWGKGAKPGKINY